jgi:dipeptidyl aminopeptidase/acylaminoacyl peptidase
MLDYLDWQSPISLEEVFSGSDGFSYPTLVHGTGALYLSSLKAERSRSVLMLILDGETEARCITPAPFSLQTKVNEYGGKPYWVDGDTIFFANAVDQCLYSQSVKNLESPPKRLTPLSAIDQRQMFTDVHQLNNHSLITICEKATLPENSMSISTVNFEPKSEPVPALKTLIEGADFYSNLVVNRASTKVAWVQWQHPNMPWDANELWIAELDCNGSEVQLTSAENVKLPAEFGLDACFCQLLFAENGDLFFSVDFRLNVIDEKASENFWNVFRYHFSKQTITQVTQGIAEYGYPHWVYGDHRIVQLDSQRLLTMASHPTGDKLTLIDQDTLALDELPIQSATLQHLGSDGHGRAVMVKLPYDAKSSLVELDFRERQSSVTWSETILAGSDAQLDNVSQAQHLSYATRDGERAYGFFYAPKNKSQQEQTEESNKPPLLVMVHGGPTARAYGHFDLQKQYWTSRGFAILDINHRGSSGYGRAFRDALYGEWGELDAQDIIDGIECLIEQNLVDGARVCIRGKSAGGYAVLRALTEYPDTFTAGACYYGIGNLVTLAETTHKFEKYYTDRLVDETFDEATANLPSSRFHQRSPINKIDQVGSAMIVFQGSLDKVVPPSVAKEVVSALLASNLDYEYVEYPDEAHGFRQVKNNIDAWGKELAFYKRALRAKS